MSEISSQYTVSVITVVLNAESDLPEVIESVRTVKANSELPIEYIVIDGKSSDRTVEIINRSLDVVDQWISEPDEGLYDAMNKGIRLARGKWLNFLNCGDQLLHVPNVLAGIGNDYDIVSGPVLINGWQYFRPRWDWRCRFCYYLHHQGTFYRKDMLMPFDLKYPICSDSNNHQKMYKSGYTCLILDDVIASHTTNGISSDKLKILEHCRVFYDNFGLSGAIGGSICYLLRGVKYHTKKLLTSHKIAVGQNSTQ